MLLIIMLDSSLSEPAFCTTPRIEKNYISHGSRDVRTGVHVGILTGTTSIKRKEVRKKGKEGGNKERKKGMRDGPWSGQYPSFDH